VPVRRQEISSHPTSFSAGNRSDQFRGASGFIPGLDAATGNLKPSCSRDHGQTPARRTRYHSPSYSLRDACHAHRATTSTPFPTFRN